MLENANTGLNPLDGSIVTVISQKEYCLPYLRSLLSAKPNNALWQEMAITPHGGTPLYLFAVARIHVSCDFFFLSIEYNTYSSVPS